MRLATLAAALVLGAAAVAAPAFAQDQDAMENYPDAPGREEAFGFCGACHSFRLVAQQGMTRLQWDESLKWMVNKHNMPELEGKDLEVILDYLEKAFPPKAPAGGRPGWSNPFAPR